MLRELKQALLFTATTMVLFGGGYHLALWGIGRVVFPAQAEGSFIRREDGSILGSRLIAQKFTQPKYFQPRPSAVDYNAASPGGSNYGPSSPNHLKTVRERVATVRVLEKVRSGLVPSEMVTTSGSGLDPHIPPAAAELQAPRVSGARGVPVKQVRALIRQHTEVPVFGFLGRARVNVLELNVALDEALGPGELAQVR